MCSHQNLGRCARSGAARVAAGSIKSEYLVLIFSFVPSLEYKMEVVVDYSVLKGAHNEIFIKELSICSDGVVQGCHLRVRMSCLLTRGRSISQAITG